MQSAILSAQTAFRLVPVLMTAFRPTNRLATLVAACSSLSLSSSIVPANNTYSTFPPLGRNVRSGPCPQGGCACRKSNPDILVVQPAENWEAKNLPGPFDGTRERRILRHCNISCTTAAGDGGGTRRARQRGRGIPVGSDRSAVRHIRFAMGNAAASADRECPLIEVAGWKRHHT